MWKPTLADVGAVPPLPARQRGEKATAGMGAESIVSLAKWLGNSDPAFMLRTYIHFMPHADVRGLSAIEACSRTSVESP